MSWKDDEMDEIWFHFVTFEVLHNVINMAELKQDQNVQIFKTYQPTLLSKTTRVRFYKCINRYKMNRKGKNFSMQKQNVNYGNSKCYERQSISWASSQSFKKCNDPFSLLLVRIWPVIKIHWTLIALTLILLHD